MGIRECRGKAAASLIGGRACTQLRLYEEKHHTVPGLFCLILHQSLREPKLTLQGQSTCIMGHSVAHPNPNDVNMTAGEPSLEASHTREEHSAPRERVCG